MKVALVLSGGGARGLAHLGVLKALEKNNVPIDQIIGCSFGAIIGGMYAQTADSRVVEKRLFAFMHDPAFKGLGLDFIKRSTVTSDDTLRQLASSIKDWVLMNLIAKRLALFKADRLQRAIHFLIEEGKVEGCKIPFACNATDLISGRPYLFTRGDIRKAIQASATIPGYFPPIRHKGKLLVDGAITYNLPVQFARQLGAEFVIAVDVHPLIHPENNFRNVFDIILRAKSITSNTLSEETLGRGDILIAPPVKEYFWYEFDRYLEIIKAGEESANLYMEDIHAHLNPKRPRRLKRMFRPG